MVRIGLLGCGFLATFYMQGLAEVPNQQVTIVYGRDKLKAADFASRWNIPRSSDDMPAVAADKDVDLLVLPCLTICTWRLPSRCSTQKARYLY